MIRPTQVIRLLLLIIPSFFYFFPLAGKATIISLKNGMEIEGASGTLSRVNENPLQSKPKGNVEARMVLFVDDGLRRTFFPLRQLRREDVRESLLGKLEKIKIPQSVAPRRKMIARIGAINRISPFNDWGRRIYSMIGPRGKLIDLHQGITEITPLWTKVEGLRAGASYSLDMRIATSSIPRTTLNAVLFNHLDPTSIDQRLRIVRLYIFSKRYKDAQLELQEVVKDFPGNEALENTVKELRQQSALQRISEIQLRRNSGQPILAHAMLKEFPSEDVADETLIRVRQLIEEDEEKYKKYQHVLKQLDAHLTELKNAALRESLNPIIEEIKRELNLNTLERMASFLLLVDDKKLSSEQKLSIAISGWLTGVGNDSAENIAISQSLFEVRGLVRRYLSTQTLVEREEILEQLKSQEGATPGHVAKLLAAMKPPLVTPIENDVNSGRFHLTTGGLSESQKISYLVQLPPEYDPYRRYPTVVTLHGTNSTADDQVQWWTGAYNEKLNMCIGQAARHGYIVIAPLWTKKAQTRYKYSVLEHAAVLSSLRDAERRFSIDTDRVYLSGHSMGGDAAWDIGLAHPDLWAGVIPIAATADKYIQRYWPNARHVPLYFVSGEFDSDKMAHNGPYYDRYFTKARFDVMLVEYLGRGHEHFSDEIQRIFTWMSLHKRDFFPQDFECHSMRKNDNFFWWTEMANFPESAIIEPVLWPSKGKHAAIIEGKIFPTQNRITLKTGGAERAIVWLSPELVDFSRPIKIRVNNRQLKASSPSIETILEDVRSRADRLHPFWAKAEFGVRRK